MQLTHQDDTPLSGLTLTAERAIDSDHVDLKIYNDGTEDFLGGFLTLYAETDPGSGFYFTSGHPATDERMGRFQITGQDSTATPGQEIVLGVVQPMGHLAVAQLPTIKAGDWILADFWLSQSGSSAGGGAVNIKIELANGVAAQPLPFGVSQVGTGIDSGRKQPRSFFIGGRAVTATGTPDDYVHAAAGSWLIQGEESADATIQDVQFDQNDGDSVALTTGEVYIAVLTQGTADAPNVTKGSKAVSGSAVKPTPPPGDLILAWVTVPYNAGTTVVDNTNIEDARTFGRYKVAAPPTGLSVTVHPGEAVIDSFRQIRSLPADVSLTASVTNRLWLEWNGDITVNTSDVPPSAGAVKLAEVTTDGSNVTANVDTRTYIRPLDAGALEVKEVSGGVDVLTVSTMMFPDGTLTDHGSGVVEFIPGAGGAVSFSASNRVLGRISSGGGVSEELDAADLNSIVGLAALTISGGALTVSGGDFTAGRAEHGIVQHDFFNSDGTDSTCTSVMRIRTNAAADAMLSFYWSEATGEVDWSLGADSAASTPGNFVLSCGTALSTRRVLEIDPNANIRGGQTNGGSWQIKTLTSTVTWSGTGACDTAAQVLPAGALILGVTLRNTTTITNVTDYEVGDDSGSAAARFASSAAVSGANSTTFACPNIWNGALATTLALSPWQTSAAKVRLTRTTGSGTQSGTTRVVVTALVFTPPTS